MSEREHIRTILTRALWRRRERLERVVCQGCDGLPGRPTCAGCKGAGTVLERRKDKAA